MKVSESMRRDPRLISPDKTLKDSARLMEAFNIGALLVSDGTRLVGMITDRDIAIRGIAQGKGPGAPVRDVMSPDVKYCYADQEVDEVARNMAELQVRRLPVISRDKRLVGMLSLTDIAKADGDGRVAGTTLREMATHATL